MARRLEKRTRLLAADTSGIEQAAAILRSGGLVAFPTETVYGLGAHALDTQAVRRIFEAKKRPEDDPLIVHLSDATLIHGIATTTPDTLTLAARFWPGPLTLVVPKLPAVPDEVTAGLDTVGIRVPSHPIARQLLAAAGLPVAAPSANLFGRPSPTRPEHVLEDLDGRIDAVLDGGPASVGVESTIVDLSSVAPRLLRPGGVAAEEIEAVLGRLLVSPTRIDGALPSPGLLPVHYSPRTPLTLIRGEDARERLFEAIAGALRDGLRIGVLALSEDVAELPEAARLEVVGSQDDPAGSAARLFDALRALDAGKLDVLFARELADPGRGLGRALADRLRRAARHVLDVRE